MFGLFNKKEKGENQFASFLPMLTPIFKMAGVNPETMLIEAARDLRATMNEYTTEVVVMIGIDQEGENFVLNFYKKNDSEFVIIHAVSIQSLDELIGQIGKLKENILSIVTNPQENDTTTQTTSEHSSNTGEGKGTRTKEQLNTTEPTELTGTIEPNDTEQFDTEIDTLDQPDGE